MLLTSPILLRRLVILYILEHHLTETVEVRDIGHVRVEESGQQRTGGGLVVNLHCDSIKSVPTSRSWNDRRKS